MIRYQSYLSIYTLIVALVLVCAVSIAWGGFAFAQTKDQNQIRSNLRSLKYKEETQKAHHIGSDTRIQSKAKFRKYPFGKTKNAPPADPGIAERMRRANRVAGAAPLTIFNANEQLSFQGSPLEDSDQKIGPRRKVFPGTKETLSQMDEYAPPQMHVSYDMGNKTTTRVSINSQDIDSPIYTPIKKDESVNAAGLYMDMGLQKDVSLHVGGEVRNNETESSTHQSAAGASVGVEWNF